MTKFKTQEFQLINCSHHMLTMLLDDKLFLAPIKTNPEKVLDVGTGTGIWAMYDFFSWFPYLFGLQQ
jgi:ubiquinone/menaquinone biosynthesis C-methylase UbiE